MKKFTVKASALAIAAALPGVAAAQVIDLDAGTGASTFASELVPAAGATVAVPNVRAVLGFGVSNGQDRYIRYDLTGAKFAAAVTAANVQADSNSCATNSNLGTATETLATGGAANATSVIFQITATDANGLSPTQNTCLSLGNVTLTSAAGASVRYSLYSTPADAVGGTASGRLATSSSSIASTASGFDVDVTPATTVVDVSTSYKKFVADAGITSVSNTAIGSFGMSAVTGVLNLSGSQVAVSDLISNANAAVAGADFTPASNTGVFFTTSANCVSAPAVTVAGTVVSSTVRNLNGLGSAAVSGNVCFVANQNNAIAEQTFTVALDVTPATGATTADIGATTLGNFDRNGTVLKAPLMTGAPGQNTWIQVVNTSSSAAPWAINCFGPSGSLGAGATGTLAAGQTGRLFASSLGCAAGTNAVEIVVSAPEGNVVGTLVRQSTTTGDSGLDSLTGNK